MTALTGLSASGAPLAYIVDDDRQLLQAVRLLFKLLKYDTQTFPNARDLARHMLASPTLPDLLVVDMSMPGVNGMDVLKWIRGSTRFRDLPILALSAETHPTLVEDALAAGANGYLFKPITLEELEAALDNIFDKPPGGNRPDRQ